jgi:hypothetical protein
MSVILLFSCFGVALAQNEYHWTKRFSQTVDQRALWQPGMQGMRDIRQVCGSARDFGDCFARQMERQGASRQAVAFTNLIGNTGYLRDFRDTGRVDIAYVNYPFRANENQGWLLVNGSPKVVDVDDLGNIPQSELMKNPQYAALARKYRNIAIFPGDRSGSAYPTVRPFGGGQRFLVDYKLVDGCHACQQIGSLHMAFDFDGHGRFLGAHFHGLN